jgi:predicted HAD superfamily phosphohydrolase YqeG
MKILLDYNRTLFNPDSDSLYQGVVGLLQDLSVRNELFLISKNEPGRADALEKLGIKKYFTSVSFVEEKTPALFKELAQGSTEVVVVGDRVRGEISLGNQLGFVTVWVKQGRFANELPATAIEQPIHTLGSVIELRRIISTYEK